MSQQYDPGQLCWGTSLLTSEETWGKHRRGPRTPGCPHSSVIMAMSPMVPLKLVGEALLSMP